MNCFYEILRVGTCQQKKKKSWYGRFSKLLKDISDLEPDKNKSLLEFSI